MIVAFDLETTGLDEESKIIEIALVKFDEKTFMVMDRLSTLVNPHIPLPIECTNVTGIRNVDMFSAPDWDDDLKKQIIHFVGENPILAHNAEFDVGMLAHHGVDLSKNIVLDTFELARMLFRNAVSLNLGILCDLLAIEMGQAHRAYDDTLATVQIFQKCCEKIATLPESHKKALSFLFGYFDTPQGIWYSRYFDWKPVSKDEFQRILSLLPSPVSLVSTSLPFVSLSENTSAEVKKWYETIFHRPASSQESILIEHIAD